MQSLGLLIIDPKDVATLVQPLDRLGLTTLQVHEACLIVEISISREERRLTFTVIKNRYNLKGEVDHDGQVADTVDLSRKP